MATLDNAASWGSDQTSARSSRGQARRPRRARRRPAGERSRTSPGVDGLQGRRGGRHQLPRRLRGADATPGDASSVVGRAPSGRGLSGRMEDAMPATATIEIHRLSPAIGAAITGIDLHGPLDDDDVRRPPRRLPRPLRARVPRPAPRTGRPARVRRALGRTARRAVPRAARRPRLPGDPPRHEHGQGRRR